MLRFHIHGDASELREKLVSHYDGSLIFAGDPGAELGDGAAFEAGEWFHLRTQLERSYAEYEMRAVDDGAGLVLEVQEQGRSRDKFLVPHVSFLLRSLGLSFRTS